jgi:hypothetical protein
MVTAKKQRLVLNHLNTLQLRQELRCHRLLSNPQPSRRLSRLQNHQPACHRPILLLLLVSLHRLLWQVRKARPSKDRKAMHSSANMADIHRLALKNSLHCPKSRMMLSANRLHPLKAHSRAIQTSNLSPRLNPNLGLSLPHPTNSPLTTLPTRNIATLTTTITISNMDCSKVLKVNRMVLLLSNDPTVVTTALRQRILLNSRKVLPNRPSHVMRLQERLKPVGTRLRTQLLKPNSQVLPRAPHPNNPGTSKDLRLETTHMAIRTTPARTMLHT